MRKKILVVTSSRADYGILKPLILKIRKKVNLKIVVTGSHISNYYGNTYKEIEKDKIKIDYKIKNIVTKNNEIGISNTIAITIKKFTKVIKGENPDIIVILGDRFEIFTCAVSALICEIPIAHIHGGELTEGSIDNSFRHSITKMSHLHFVSHMSAKKRIVQMGENPKSVFNVGSLSVEQIQKEKFYKKNELEKYLGFKLQKKNIFITLHPNTIERKKNLYEINQLLNALKHETDSLLLFSYSNFDKNSKMIIEKIKKFTKSRKNTYLVKSLGQKLFYSILNNFDILIGNSSSGIIEAPSFKIAIINIGERQKGRVMSKKIIQSKNDSISIQNAIKKAKSLNYSKLVSNTINPYHKKNTVNNIIKIILNHPLDKIFKRVFYNKIS